MSRVDMKKDGYTSGWYDYRSHEACLASWEGYDRKVEKIPFEWYFLLSTKDFEKVQAKKRFEEEVYNVVPVDGGRYVKIYSETRWGERRPFLCWLRENKADALEADLNPINRFLSDNDIKFADDLRYLFYDFETDPRSGWSDIPGQRVLSVAFQGHNGKTEGLVANSDDNRGEFELLDEFASVIEQHDVLIAWNGDFFDERVLRARTKRLGMRINWNMINFFDMMEMFQHPYFGYGRDSKNKGVKVSYSLGNIAQKLLGYGKLEDVPGYLMDRIWKQDPEKVRRYNMRDVDIMVDLESKFKYIEGHKVLTHLCNRFLSSKALRIGNINDGFILKYGHENGKSFGTKKTAYYEYDDDSWKEEVDTSKFKGAFVMEPAPGIHEDVVLVDFASLYPNIIRSFNISPETKLDEDAVLAADRYGLDMAVASNGATFEFTLEGVFPAIVQTAMERRKKWKDLDRKLEEEGQGGTVEHRKAKQRSDAYKVMANGTYGILGAPTSRFYDRDCAEAVTMTGRTIINFVIEWAREVDIPALYGDTDSVFLRCSVEKAKEFIEKAAELIDNWIMDRGGKPGFIRLEIDGDYNRIFWTRKKKYAGLLRGEKEPEIKGLEFVRTDNCRVTRLLQEQLINFLLFDSDPNPREAEKIVDNCFNKLYRGDIDIQDLVITQAVQKKLHLYVSKTPAVRVAQKMLDDGKEFFPGMKIPYILTGRKDGYLVAVHADEEKPEYDVNLYWKNKIYPATERILKAVFGDAVRWKELGDVKTKNQSNFLAQ